MTNWRLWIGLAISVATIYLVLQQVDLALVARHMSGAEPLMMLVLIASVPVTLWMKAARWRLFFNRSDPVTTSGLFSAMMIGYMVSVIVPLRAGELVRVFLVADSARISWSRVLATVIVEKVLDVLAVAVLLVALTTVLSLPDSVVLMAQAGSALVIVCLLGLAALLFMEHVLLGILATAERIVPVLKRLGLKTLLVSFNQGLAFIHDRAAVAQVAAWTAAIWVAGAFTIWAALAGTNVVSTIESSLLVLAVTNLGMVVPSAPGYVGTYHWLVFESLKVFSVDSNQAAGTAVVLHGLTFGTVLVGGLLFLWRGQYSLGRLLRSSRQAAGASHSNGDGSTMVSGGTRESGASPGAERSPIVASPPADARPEP